MWFKNLLAEIRHSTQKNPKRSVWIDSYPCKMYRSNISTLIRKKYYQSHCISLPRILWQHSKSLAGSGRKIPGWLKCLKIKPSEILKRPKYLQCSIIGEKNICVLSESKIVSCPLKQNEEIILHIVARITKDTKLEWEVKLSRLLLQRILGLYVMSYNFLKSRTIDQPKLLSSWGMRGGKLISVKNFSAQ